MSDGNYNCTACRVYFADRCVNLRCPVGYHNVASIDADKVIGHADKLEDMINSRYSLGQVVAAETVAPRLRKLSGEEYAAKRDDRARFLRELADSFEKEAAAEREDWKKNHH